MNDCIIFPGYKRNGGAGYGERTVRGVRVLAHRHAYATQVGEIPDGLLVCHKCNNKPCVNPEHLYLATNAQNVADAWRDGLGCNQNTVKTCCSKCGGPFRYSESLGGRFCPACKRESDRRTRKTRKAARADTKGTSA